MTATSAASASPMKRLLAAVFVLNLIEFLQSGMVAFATVPLMGYLSASPEEYSVVTALYAAVAVTTTALGYTLLRRVGWRRYLLAGLAVFALGAALCATSDDLWQFGCGRLLMAAGGGSFMTSARMLINVNPPSPQRIKGIAAFGGSLTAGLAAAPWLASMMVGADAWRGMFALFIELALLAAAVVAMLPFEREQTDGAARIDWLGAAALAAGTFAVLYALQRAIYDFHGEPLDVVVSLVAGMLLIAVFLWRQLRTPEPLLRIRGLLNARYGAGLLIFLLCYVVLGTTNTMLPLFVQRGLGVAWEVAGAAQGAGLSSAMAAFVLLLTIVKRRPAARKFYVTAFAALAVCGLLLSDLSSAANVWTDVVPALACLGAFLILALATTALHAFRDLQHDEAAFFNGQQLKNMLSQFGLGLGVALANVGFQARATHHYAVLAERIAEGGTAFGTQLDQLATALGTPQLAMVQIAQQVTQQATLVASVEVFWLLMWFGVLGVAVMGLQRVFE
ncbi:MFS transporter [Oxalobacteraceae bacterium OM1]|nr:MFS transporter [Oxalobacteraceae bacterium OM1]